MTSLSEQRSTRTASATRGPRTFVHSGVICGIAVLAVVLAIADASGCPTCKDAVNTSDVDGLNVARGYFYSILLMLAMPFTLVGSFGCYVWREMRRQQRTPGGSPQP